LIYNYNLGVGFWGVSKNNPSSSLDNQGYIARSYQLFPGPAFNPSKVSLSFESERSADILYKKLENKQKLELRDRDLCHRIAGC
jgi:hypothetical protein